MYSKKVLLSSKWFHECKIWFLKIIVVTSDATILSRFVGDKLQISAETKIEFRKKNKNLSAYIKTKQLSFSNMILQKFCGAFGAENDHK